MRKDRGHIWVHADMPGPVGPLWLAIFRKKKKERMVVVMAVGVVVGFLTATAFWESRAQVKFNTYSQKLSPVKLL